MAGVYRSSDMGDSGRVPRLAWAGAAVVAASLLVALGVAVGRVSMSSVASTGARPTSPGVAAPAATASVLPIAMSAGPTGVDHGVPVGYSHSSDGAFLAAEYYSRIFGSELVLHPDAYRAAMRVMAAPGADDLLRSKAETVITTLETRRHLVSNAARGLPVVIGSYGLAGRVTSYSDQEATVELFGASVVSDGTGDLAAGFGGGSMLLRWVPLAGGSGDWRIADAHSLDAWATDLVSFPGAPGPNPPFVRDLTPVDYAPPGS